MNVADTAGKIHVLSGDVVSRIAAGEVVERPAAVVKELIENSLDAGSTKVSIDVKNGGLGFIRVVDDGEGMSRPDAQMAFQRHATSKLASDGDLWSIRTRGFRGEALSSIASISKVRLVTAGRNEPTGTQVALKGGEVEEVSDAAAPVGTLIEVSDLFFNTPARKKFLKTTTTEFSHVSLAVQQASLSSPGTQFRLTHNGQQVLELPRVGSREDRVLQVYHERFVKHCLPLRGKGAGVGLEGYIVNPIHARAGRTPQDLFVNGRPVKNATVAHAIYEGYGSFLARGRHPLFVLFLEVDPERVDVNVHPTKREVRFLDQDMVHREVSRAVRASLGSVSVGAGETNLRTVPSDGGPVAASVAAQEGSAVQDQGWPDSAGTRVGRPSPPFAQGALPLGAGRQERGGLGEAQDPTVPYRAETTTEVRPLGQVSQTFLVAQVGEELHVVDQHTAHERVLFERLQRALKDHILASQPLLIPEPVDLPTHEAVILRQHLADLEKVGLLIEPFGASSFIIRSVPSLVGHVDYGSLLQDLVDDLAQWNSLSALEKRIQSVFATLACHGAVRAGREMGLPEIRQLIEDWVAEGLPTTCPHGRRIALRLPTEELARIFGRV
jgi:DNA mismatch repair protein MutL